MSCRPSCAAVRFITAVRVTAPVSLRAEGRSSLPPNLKGAVRRSVQLLRGCWLPGAWLQTHKTHDTVCRQLDSGLPTLSEVALRFNRQAAATQTQAVITVTAPVAMRADGEKAASRYLLPAHAVSIISICYCCCCTRIRVTLSLDVFNAVLQDVQEDLSFKVCCG